jgi:hypothetical protein
MMAARSVRGSQVTAPVTDPSFLPPCAKFTWPTPWPCATSPWRFMCPVQRAPGSRGRGDPAHEIYQVAPRTRQRGGNGGWRGQGKSELDRVHQAVPARPRWTRVTPICPVICHSNTGREDPGACWRAEGPRFRHSAVSHRVAPGPREPAASLGGTSETKRAWERGAPCHGCAKPPPGSR